MWSIPQRQRFTAVFKGTALAVVLALPATAIVGCSTGNDQLASDTNDASSQSSTTAPSSPSAQSPVMQPHPTLSSDSDTAASPQPTQDPDSSASAFDPTIITYTSVGPIRLGDTGDRLLELGAQPPAHDGLGNPPPPGSKCETWPLTLSSGATLWTTLKSGRVLAVRENTPTPSAAMLTDRGIKVGDTAAELRAQYPQIKPLKKGGGQTLSADFHQYSSTDGHGHTIIWALNSTTPQRSGTSVGLPDDATISGITVVDSDEDFYEAYEEMFYHLCSS